jgi:hypothetical protein
MRLIIGVFLIFFLSPVTLWVAELQDLSWRFLDAEQVEITSDAEGYVALEGIVEPTLVVPCPDGGDCVYVKNTELENVALEGETDRWEEKSSHEAFGEFTIGEYKVYPREGTVFIGEKDFDSDEDGRMIEYEYLAFENVMLVTGNAQGGEIEFAADDEAFIISPYSYLQTAEEVKKIDKGMTLGLRIFSLILMVLGFIALTAQFAAPIAGVLKVVPFLGSALNTGVQGVIYFAVSVFAALVWLVLLAAVVVLNSFWLFLAAVLLVAGLLKYGLIKFPEKK